MKLIRKLMQFILHFHWLFTSFCEGILSMPDVCSSVCSGPMDNDSIIVEKCTEDFVIIDRCCVNKTSSVIHSTDVIGIDLTGCDLQYLNKSLLPLVNVISVALENNSITGNLQYEFYGLSQMEYLSLPPGVTCPGGNESWENITHSDQRTVCEDQINLCSAFNCPDSSHCVPQGPGLKDCLCDEGYHGYKCLRSGRFHTEAFGFGLAGVTVALSAFLWITQRRHVKKRA